MRQEDVERCGRICHAAFREIAERHNFRPDFAVPEAAIQFAQGFYASPDVFSVVAERDAANLLQGQPLSFLLSVRQSSLFRWCLSKRLRVLKMMNLMTMGEYQEPRGCYLPSVGY